MAITTRAGKASALTHEELDANFTSLGLAHGDTSIDLDVDTINATGIKARGTLSISDPTVGAVDNHQARLIVDESNPDNPKLKVQLVEGASDTVADYISMYNGEIIVDKAMSINTDITTYGKNPDNTSIYSSNDNYDGHSFIRTGQYNDDAKTSVLFQTVYGSSAQVGQGTGYWTTIRNNDGAFHAGAVISSLKSYTSATDYATELQFRPVKNDNGTLDLNSSILKVNHDGVTVTGTLTSDGIETNAALVHGPITMDGDLTCAGNFTNQAFELTHNIQVDSTEATISLATTGGGTRQPYIILRDPDNEWGYVKFEQYFSPVHRNTPETNTYPLPPLGAMCFDTSTNTFKGWNGTSWVVLG